MKIAFSLNHIKNKNALEITTNGKTYPKDYARFMTYVDSLGNNARQKNDFTWWINDKEIDNIMNMFAEIMCMNETVASIKGAEPTIIPNFKQDNIFLDEFILEPFPFQKVGISFLREIKCGILGDSMGLGKTNQAIGAIHQLIKLNKINKIIIVVPASLKFQWQSELLKFINYKSIISDGTKVKRNKIYKEFVETDVNILIVGYETLRNDIEEIKELPNDCMILDEAHRLKNRKTKLYKAIIELNPEYKFGLTGTPMQNRPEEIYALMSWINPNILGKVTAFNKRHIIVGEKFGKRYVDLGYKHLDEIRDNISPFILRRMKEDVAPDLPEIITNTIFVTMNKAQEDLYKEVESDYVLLQKEIREFLEDNQDKMLDKESQDKISKASKEEKVLGYMYLMEAISDHPFLLLNGNSNLAKKYSILAKKCKTSPKLEALIDICLEMKAQGSKIIIFTKYQRMLVLITKKIEATFNETPYLIHGSISSEDRHKAVEEFSSKETQSSFMVLTDAGNYGLNLQTADVLINYDNPWNPAVADQRAGRIHRIGSTYKVINVIKMATLGTFDEVILKGQEKKEKLNKGLVDRTDEEVKLLLEMIEKAK